MIERLIPEFDVLYENFRPGDGLMAKSRSESPRFEPIGHQLRFSGQ